MAAAFQIKKSGPEKFIFNLKSGNGDVLLTSEAYSAKEEALVAIEAARTNSKLDERFERKTAANGSPYVVLKTANGQVIARSEMFSSNMAMNNGIASMQRNGPVAVVSDETES